jgi:hypothetical protein
VGLTGLIIRKISRIASQRGFLFEEKPAFFVKSRLFISNNGALYWIAAQKSRVSATSGVYVAFRHNCAILGFVR